MDAFFDFQKTELREDTRAALARDAQWLNKFPSVEILLEGHCDDRGTDAYNLALGAERAAAVRGYLISRNRRFAHPDDFLRKRKTFLLGGRRTLLQENRRAHVLVTAK